MTMQQSCEHDVFNAVTAIEAKRLMAGYDAMEVMELEAMRAILRDADAGVDSTEAMREELKTIGSETPVEALQNRLSDPDTVALLDDVLATRKFIASTPLAKSDERLKAVYRDAVRHQRKWLTDEEVDRCVSDLVEVIWQEE